MHTIPRVGWLVLPHLPLNKNVTQSLITCHPRAQQPPLVSCEIHPPSSPVTRSSSAVTRRDEYRPLHQRRAPMESGAADRPAQQCSPALLSLCALGMQGP